MDKNLEKLKNELDCLMENMKETVVILDSNQALDSPNRATASFTNTSYIESPKPENPIFSTDYSQPLPTNNVENLASTSPAPQNPANNLNRLNCSKELTRNNVETIKANLDEMTSIAYNKGIEEGYIDGRKDGRLEIINTMIEILEQYLKENIPETPAPTPHV